MMMMVVRMARLILLFLFMSHGVSSADWAVNYSPSSICALKDSSVIINCNYKYPTGRKIKKVFWTKEPQKEGKEPPDLSKDPKYSQRLQYLGNKKQNCTIRLSHVTKTDEHKYYFRFTTVPEGKWLGIPGVSLSVTDLQVESPKRVKEGDSVRLTCKSSCKLTDTPTFIWYRNSQPLTEKSNELLLKSVTREDAGRYRCAVHGHTLTSPEVKLNVTYPPRSVSASISRSGEIVSGDAVTMTCSSDANPPALFSWFKGKMFKRSGKIFYISKISSDDSGEYKCKARNEHGEKYSNLVTLNVMYPPRSVSVFKNGSDVIVPGSSVTLTCMSDSNPPAEIIWFKQNQSSAVGSGQSFSAVQSGNFYCEARNPYGSQRSDSVTLTVQHRGIFHLAIVVSLCGIVAAVIIVLLTCYVKKKKLQSKTLTNCSDGLSIIFDPRQMPCVYENVMAVHSCTNSQDPIPIYENISVTMTY